MRVSFQSFLSYEYIVCSLCMSMCKVFIVRKLHTPLRLAEQMIYQNIFIGPQEGSYSNYFNLQQAALYLTHVMYNLLFSDPCASSATTPVSKSFLHAFTEQEYKPPPVICASFDRACLNGSFAWAPITSYGNPHYETSSLP